MTDPGFVSKGEQDAEIKEVSISARCALDYLLKLL